MATMTIAEAEHVIDILAAALLPEPTSSNCADKRISYSNLYYRLSTLQGYDVFQIDTALKLRIANMFLFLAGKDDFEEKFAEEIQICRLPLPLQLELFIPDDLMDKFEQLDELSKTLSCDSSELVIREASIHKEIITRRGGNLIENKKFQSLETEKSFGNCCKHIGANDPIYWQKIYARIGIEYTSTSPKGNTPVYIEKKSDFYDDNNIS